MNALQILGLIAGYLFATAAVPSAWKALRSGKTQTPLSISWSVLGGTIFMYLYLFGSHGFDWVLTLVYSVEALSWGTLVFYGVRGK